MNKILDFDKIVENKIKPYLNDSIKISSGETTRTIGIWDDIELKKGNKITFKYNDSKYNGIILGTYWETIYKGAIFAINLEDKGITRSFLIRILKDGNEWIIYQSTFKT